LRRACIFERRKNQFSSFIFTQGWPLSGARLPGCTSWLSSQKVSSETLYQPS
jgi:hypothetical protein